LETSAPSQTFPHPSLANISAIQKPHSALLGNRVPPCCCCCCCTSRRTIARIPKEECERMPQCQELKCSCLARCTLPGHRGDDRGWSFGTWRRERSEYNRDPLALFRGPDPGIAPLFHQRMRRNPCCATARRGHCVVQDLAPKLASFNIGDGGTASILHPNRGTIRSPTFHHEQNMPPLRGRLFNTWG
jgi:hypothetical protein